MPAGDVGQKGEFSPLVFWSCKWGPLYVFYQNSLSGSFFENYSGLAKNAFDLILANPPFAGNVDDNDIEPTLCELTGTKLAAAKIHGRCFAPQLRGQPGTPREWIHIQNGNNRQVRSSEYMLDNKNQLRRVVKLWEEPAKPNENLDPDKEAIARKSLQAVLDLLGNE